MTFVIKLDDLKKVVKTKTFLYGLIIRIATIIILLGLVNVINDLNDMNEIVYQALNYLSKGINPYGQWYFLNIFNYGFFEGHNQQFFGYGPFMLILYLPTILWPSTLASIGTMDFMPTFVLMNNIFDFLIFYQLHKHKTFQKISWIYWANPLFVLMGTFSFFNSIFLLITLGFVNLENPRISALYFTLASIAYQYVLIFLAFVFIYHFKELKDFILGALPAILITGFFILWGPGVFVKDVFLMQFSRNYISWTSVWARDAPIAYATSIPAIVFNLTGGALVVPAYLMHFITLNLTGNPIPPLWWPYNFQFDIGLQISTYMMILTIGVFAILILHNFLKKDRDRTFDYIVIVYCAVIAANQTGLYHYWFLLIIPLLFYYYKHEFYSEIKTNELK
ncbi:MAG: hypothetical protein ACTSRG_11755 [Candidatus Helarchaeota archaeon]